MSSEAPGSTDPAWGGPAYRMVVLLCAAAMLIALVLTGHDPSALQFVLGPLSPVLVTLTACAVGLWALRTCLARGWIPRAGGTRRGYSVALLAGVALPLPAIAMDLLGGFPADLNIAAPQAYLAYPAIALVAEFIFHVVLMSVVAVVHGTGSEPSRRARGVAFGLAMLPEPILQVAWGASQSPLWANLAVGPHLLVFNAVEVWLLTRHGFLAAYVLRLAYYSIWHVAWGQIRLSLLLGG